MEETKGVIYILTNPSFPDYVKIGYADDVNRRVRELNRSECTPFAFRIYAYYKVAHRLDDIKLHNIIDTLNPDLRSIDVVEGKKRVREFYAMKPEHAYALFEAIAQLNGLEDNLVKVPLNPKDKHELQESEQISNESRMRNEVFNFSKCGIPVGAELLFVKNPNIRCHVVDERHIEYNGEVMYLTTLAKMILNKKTLAGPTYFTYNGVNLQRYYEKYQMKN